MFFRKNPQDARYAVSYCINNGQLTGIDESQQERIVKALQTLWACDAFNEVNKTWSNSSTYKFICLCMGWA